MSPLIRTPKQRIIKYIYENNKSTKFNLKEKKQKNKI